MWFSRKRVITSAAESPVSTQLTFNTKRANSVLAENFLHPIEVSPCADEPLDLTEKSRKKRSRSIFSNSFKKRIGPSDEHGKSNGNHTAPVRRDSIDPRLHSNTGSIDALRRTVESSSKQNSISCTDDAYDEEELGDFVMAPTNTDDMSLLHPFEVEARAILDKLGIPSEMLFRSIESGPRSDSIGAYRIIIHRLQRRKLMARQQEAAEAEAQPQPAPKSVQKCAIL